MVIPSPVDTALAIATDDAYVLPSCALLRSIARHGELPAGHRLYILHHGLSPRSVDELTRAAADAHFALELVHLDPEAVAQFGAVDPGRIATCLRLFLGEVCATPRVLYLDSDMLVLDSLVPLLTADLGGRSAAAVPNHPPFETLGVAIRRSQRGSLAADLPYFNAGVVLLDTRLWNERGIGIRGRQYLSSHPRSRLLDQDALNIALVGDWLALDRIWNAPAGPLDVGATWAMLEKIRPAIRGEIDRWAAAQRSARILHFTGHPKPWTADYPWDDLQTTYSRYAATPLGPLWPAAESAETRTFHRS